MADKTYYQDQMAQQQHKLSDLTSLEPDISFAPTVGLFVTEITHLLKIKTLII